MKKTNKLISILIVFAMLLSIVPMNLSVSAAPDTDYNGYYKITNAGNLAWFACLVVGDTSQSGITEAEPDAKAVLTADIDITVLGDRLGKSWVGIGTEEIPFTGIFDGNGYTIKGLITDTDLTKSSVATVPVDAEKQGLFGVIGKGGVVRDVIVEGTANLSDTIKYGGICSENNGTIENVLSMVTVTGGDNADIFCHTNNGTITNSFTNQTTSVASGVTVVDADTLASGSVAYDLGASFGQTIGADTQPVHFDGTNRVYKDGDTYTNIEPTYVASVTDKDGNLIGNYKTFEDAATAAKANPNSTLKLLDNADGCYVRFYSPFTLDLNGYTLDMGNENFDIGSVLEGYDCHLTVTDTSETETGKIISASYSSVFYVGYLESPGKLTIINGTVEYNNGFFDEGLVILSGKGIVEIKGGTLKNNAGAELYIDSWRDNFEGSANISGGTFPDGFEMKVNSSDNTSTENYLTDLLAEGYAFYDKDGNKITVAEDATSIEGYVQVKEYFAASVTDAEGELIGKYKTFNDAITAAEANENSTLTLLDDVTITEYQYISSGNFTIDLNGKTLSGEDTYILHIQNSVVLTVTDSGENGTIEMNSGTNSCIFNYGKLTVEKVTIKGSRGIDNRGICTLDGITIEVSDREAFTNDGTAYIYNSVLKSEKDGAIANKSGAILYVYDSNLTGDAGITNYSTVYVYDCEIKGISYAALNLLRGIIEITGSSLSGTDLVFGYYSGTPYGEWTVDYDDGATLVLKDVEFPNGFVVDDAPAHTFLTDGYHFRDEDGNIINLTEDQRIIDGYVKVTKGADLEKEAVITLDQTEFTYTGGEIKPTVTVTVGGKTLIEGKDYTIAFSNNTNAGTATVTVKAIGQTVGGIAGGTVGDGNVNIENSSNEGAIDSGNYTGEITKEFTIIPATVDIIWSETTEFEYDGNPHSVTATYVDVNGEVVSAAVENGTNTKLGTHTATASITDANYVASEETVSVDYEIRGKATLSGTVTTFLSETEEITLTLVKVDDAEVAYETVVTGNSAEYVFDGLIEGTYIITVSKNNHATRTYEVTVDGNEDVQDVKIHLLGDINGDGKLNSVDVARTNAHARGVSVLTGYELACADVNGNGTANSIDVARMNAHVRSITTLW